jgi:hypothetical protein
VTHKVQCGTSFDLPENEGKDAAPGTFLRYLAVHFEQSREITVYVGPIVVDNESIIRGVCFEA